MAPRPYWTGYLKLSLVTCAVSLTPARSGRERVRFHTLDAATGNRLRSRYLDAETGDPVEAEDEVRGYEVEKDRFVAVEDEEIAALAFESTHSIAIESFVPEDEIGWIWYDAPYYMRPDDEVAGEAFAVIRAAMAATGMAGVSRLVLSRRERAVLLLPRGKGILLWTLRYGDEVREPDGLFDTAGAARPDPKLLGLTERLIADMTRAWEPSMASDPVEERLKEIIAAKRRKTAKPKRKAPEPEAPEGVPNIMDALRRSLSEERKRR